MIKSQKEAEMRARRLVGRNVDLKLGVARLLRERDELGGEQSAQLACCERDLEVAQEMVTELQRHNVELECELEAIRMETMMQQHEKGALEDELSMTFGNFRKVRAARAHCGAC